MLIVQCDFDDTITEGNVSTAIREAFAPDGWTSMEDEYVAGKYSVEESNIRQFALVTAGEKEIEDFVLGVVVVRYDFDQFVNYCEEGGVRLVIVSSGLDIYIKPTMALLGFDNLEMHSGKAQVTGSGGIKVEYTDPSGTVITQGFKESYLRHFKSAGDTVIYIGDGLSDITPAKEADFVIARSTLEEHFEKNGLPYTSFNTFSDVAKRVIEIQKQFNE